MTPSRTVLTLVLASFGIWFVSGKMLQKTTASTGDDTMTFIKPFLGWAAVLLFLTVMADLDATTELSTSFAWLILIATFINVGYDGFMTIATSVRV